jgi:Radical SAM superfamily
MPTRCSSGPGRTPGRAFSPTSGVERHWPATSRRSARCWVPRRCGGSDRPATVPVSQLPGVSRGCPHRCEFCYKDAFYQGGKSFYTRAVDEVLAEIQRLPGRHLYLLDDHLLGHRRFAATLFAGMRGMGRVFQGASTVNAILDSDLIEQAAQAGMRSVFIGFETLNPENLRRHAKRQNLARNYDGVIRRVHSLSIMSTEALPSAWTTRRRRL